MKRTYKNEKMWTISLVDVNKVPYKKNVLYRHGMELDRHGSRPRFVRVWPELVRIWWIVRDLVLMPIGP